MSRAVALVTGGLGGLGAEICRHLAANGHRVVAIDVASHPGAPSAQALEPSTALGFMACDVTRDEECRALVEQVERDTGPIRILVNAAGITRDATLRKLEPDDWEQVLQVNLGGAYRMSRHVLAPMIERHDGRIVNIGSINGQTGQFGQTNYAASKAGLHGFTMALARETAARGITVNTISPGYIDTAMTRAMRAEIRAGIEASIPVGRVGTPADIAAAVGFICSPAAAYITGANLPVNGGLFMSF